MCSRADYRLEITAHSYSNPGGRCAGSGGSCCDLRESDCFTTADPYLIFCLKPAGESSSNTSLCPLGKNVSNMEFNNIDSFDFATGGNALFGLPNPLPFTVTGSLPVRQ